MIDIKLIREDSAAIKQKLGEADTDTKEDQS